MNGKPIETWREFVRRTVRLWLQIPGDETRTHLSDAIAVVNSDLEKRVKALEWETQAKQAIEVEGKFPTELVTRIAEALERLSPPPPKQKAPPAPTESDQGFHLSETGAEYEARIREEFALAISLNVAPWSPAFQKAIEEMRNDLMKPRIDKDDEGNPITRTYSKDEAEEIVRESFKLAKAVANER